MGFGFALAPQAKAGFIGNYALNQFTLTNTNADGSAFTPDFGLSLVLTGGNNGSGDPGTTDFTRAATAAGLVQFQYSYSSLDDPGAIGSPFDFAGYLLGGAFLELAHVDGQSGSAMFAVAAGQVFGFRAGTLDNLGEPGILTISNFSAPSGAAVPEPGAAPVLLAAAAALATARRMNRTSRREEGAA